MSPRPEGRWGSRPHSCSPRMSASHSLGTLGTPQSQGERRASGEEEGEGCPRGALDLKPPGGGGAADLIHASAYSSVKWRHQDLSHRVMIPLLSLGLINNHLFNKLLN